MKRQKETIIALKCESLGEKTDLFTVGKIYKVADTNPCCHMIYDDLNNVQAIGFRPCSDEYYSVIGNTYAIFSPIKPSFIYYNDYTISRDIAYNQNK